MDNSASDLFIAVMDLQEAKKHQIQLKEQGVNLSFKTNGATCTTGCKVTVEVWADAKDGLTLQEYFKADYLNNVKGHEPNFGHLAEVFDLSVSIVTCQACGMKFSPALSECPDCGLVYL